MKGHSRIRGIGLSKSVATLISLLCFGTITPAFLRNHYSDQEVVGRAEIIVVAAMQEGSLTFVPLGSRSTDGWEHRLTLSISEVLKGTAPSNSIAVSIDGGLTPLVGGYHSNQFGTVFDYRSSDFPSNMVRIYDTGSSAKPSRSVSGDIRTNHIWLLRFDPPIGNSKIPGVPPQIIGIHDPEDIQSLWRREDLSKYLR